MLFEIDHVTLYHYSSPVLLGDHVLRVLPFTRPQQRIMAFDLQLVPDPVSVALESDDWGNPLHRVQFAGETERLEIRARLAVETLPAPIDVTTTDFAFPPAPVAHVEVADAYLERLEQAALLEQFVSPLVSIAGGSGMAFLHALNDAVHTFHHRGVRVDGPPQRPSETLARRDGVCRDLSVLFMAACRQFGLPARFVSGYQQGDGMRSERYLHAWPEVFIAGSGWVGFDPAHATLVGTQHVAVAAAPTAAAVTPVEGSYSFRTPTLQSTLSTEIHIATQ